MENTKKPQLANFNASAEPYSDRIKNLFSKVDLPHCYIWEKRRKGLLLFHVIILKNIFWRSRTTIGNVWRKYESKYGLKPRKKNGKTEKGDCQFNSWFNPSGVSVLSFLIQKFSLLRRIDRFSPWVLEVSMYTWYILNCFTLFNFSFSYRPWWIMFNCKFQISNNYVIFLEIYLYTIMYCLI